jgi:flagellar biosynthesis/type III secretory pathway ATPase
MAWLTKISTLTQSLQAAAEQATDVVRAVGLDGHLVSTRRWLQCRHALAVDGPAVPAAVSCMRSYHDAVNTCRNKQDTSLRTSSATWRPVC